MIWRVWLMKPWQNEKKKSSQRMDRLGRSRSHRCIVQARRTAWPEPILVRSQRTPHRDDAHLARTTTISTKVQVHRLVTGSLRRMIHSKLSKGLEPV